MRFNFLHCSKATRSHRIFSFILCSLLLLLSVTQAAAEQFRIGIMQAEKGVAEKFAPLEKYLRAKGLDIKFVEAPNYPAAARMFANGEVDGMFSGSGVAGSMLIKDVAYPLVRPVSQDGHSTYWATVVARKGAAKFTRDGSYFKGKKVTFCSLASSGEFYFRALPGAVNAASNISLAKSHGDAIKAVSEGKADIAIVKNWVWDNSRGSYPELEQVGNDSEQNPDNTLIISKKAERKTVEDVAKALLALKGDNGAEAAAVRNQLKISGYVITTAIDFKHTLEMLKAAGVGPEFNFSF